MSGANGTFETFFDLNQKSTNPDDLGSLAALFSNNPPTDKKRPLREEQKLEGDNKNEWITNKKK